MNEFLTPPEIKAKAASLGMTIPALCKKAGIAPSTFYRWSHDDLTPTITVYQRIIDALTPTQEPAQ